MPSPHTPKLEAIDALEDWGVRLYAIIGANMTFASTLELAVFRLYQEASDLPTDAAAKIFYRHVKFEHKRDVTDAAVRAALKDHRFLDYWPPILQNLQAVAGPMAHRNLVGHNPVEDDLTIVKNPDTGGADMYLRYFVRQNPMQVQIGQRQAQEAGYLSLKNYAVAQYACLWEVKDFTDRLRAALGRYHPADDLGPEPIHLQQEPRNPVQQ